ncbi:MAG TPA: aminotransferase class I/II-fold pyridoxal phosphate-dependent enzyme [Candidatus Xenobia bacterium]|jgi:cystathionine beta-lyase/cystathionine gamma-synthase
MSHQLDTQVIHAGERRLEGAVAFPIFQSAMFETGPEVRYDDIRYIRLNNTPNHAVLEAKLKVLEGAEAALVTGSGMAAITATLLTLLSQGDHVLAQGVLYGGTHSFITEDLPSFGISHDFFDAARPETWASKLKASTRVIYVETISNPLLRVGDLHAVAAFAREHGLVSVIDNTFATPINYRPLEHGFDISLHSATKYLNGHSDIVAGVVLGRSAHVQRITHRLNHLGGCLDPHACFLLHRGLKTLALRVRRQNLNAQTVAEYLSRHPGVVKVNYPGLAGHPDHERARHQLKGFGGVLSFELAGDAAVAQRFIEKTELPVKAPSLGGVETLITRPCTTSHAGMPAEERRRLGISDALIRLAVGIEDAADLVEDLGQALEAVTPHTVGGRP